MLGNLLIGFDQSKSTQVYAYSGLQQLLWWKRCVSTGLAAGE